jgi:mono/diheme cytochrome c family protein
MKKLLFALCFAVPALTVTAPLSTASAEVLPQNGDQPSKRWLVQRGRYLVAVAGCNDCHTPGYAESGGTVAKRDWLTGSSVGFAGPWGVTYPANLRLELQNLSEAQWLAEARLPRRPPMPWFALRDMREVDLRAIYWYIRGLGPQGGPAPEYLLPGEPITTPYIEFTPKLP